MNGVGLFFCYFGNTSFGATLSIYRMPSLPVQLNGKDTSTRYVLFILFYFILVFVFFVLLGIVHRRTSLQVVAVLAAVLFAPSLFSWRPILLGYSLRPQNTYIQHAIFSTPPVTNKRDGGTNKRKKSRCYRAAGFYNNR